MSLPAPGDERESYPDGYPDDEEELYLPYLDEGPDQGWSDLEDCASRATAYLWTSRMVAGTVIARHKPDLGL